MNELEGIASLMAKAHEAGYQQGAAAGRTEVERLHPVIAAARDLWQVGAPLRDKLPALAAALDALDAQPQPREDPHA